jgi:MoaA/NifB/PqqE/SkfB family radical SAM enzyme
MVHTAALPEHLPYSLDKTILTFVVPAPDGCNLKCPYCFIDRRKEDATSLDLKPKDYASFIAEVAAREDIGAICIQGYEPLLPESFVYTREILAAGQRLGVPTSLVTNGTYLSDRIEELAALAPHKITVSIDAADGATHDKSRGKIGAFVMALSGLKKAAAHPVLQPVLVLASILMPQKHERLMGMPALAAELGIEHWVVTILQSVGKDEIGGAVGDRRRIFQDLLLLKREAAKHDIAFVVDDEFGTLSEADLGRSVVDISALRIRRLARPAGTFRLLPTGQCSMGVEILREIREDAPRWMPGEVHAADFLASMRTRSSA